MKNNCGSKYSMKEVKMIESAVKCFKILYYTLRSVMYN